MRVYAVVDIVNAILCISVYAHFILVVYFLLTIIFFFLYSLFVLLNGELLMLDIDKYV